MSGHSKWSTIKHKKAAADSKRGKVFSRLLKEITVAARLGGGDLAGNPRLRAAVVEARAVNIPNDTIERAVKKGSGELGAGSFEAVTLEGYGPGGVAILVEAATDNRNRTVGELRHAFDRHGGSLGESGCVSWMFRKRGYFVIERAAVGALAADGAKGGNGAHGAMDEEGFMELAVELGAEDFAVDAEAFELFTAVEEFLRVAEELARREIPVAVQELAMIPQSYVEVDAHKAPQVLRLVEALEEHDDVQKVWANFDIDAGVLTAQTR